MFIECPICKETWYGHLPTRYKDADMVCKECVERQGIPYLIRFSDKNGKKCTAVFFSPTKWDARTGKPVDMNSFVGNYPEGFNDLEVIGPLVWGLTKNLIYLDEYAEQLRNF